MSAKNFHRFVGLLIALAISFGGVSPALAAPPSNDNFADALVVNSLPFTDTVDIAEAGVEPGEPDSCFATDRTAWYSFTPSESVTVRITRGGTTTFSNVSVFRAAGNTINDLELIGCPLYNPAPMVLEAGQKYYIQAGAYPGEVGTIQVNIDQAFPPENDNFTGAEDVSSLPFNATVDVTDASIESGEVRYCTMEGLTIWYVYTPAVDTFIQADSAGSSIGSQVTIYSSYGSTINELNFMGCAAYGQPFNFPVEAGQTYYFQIGSTEYGEYGSVQLNLQEILPPPNDNIASPELITSLPFSTGIDLTAAGIESNEPQSCSNFGKSVWYAFTPADNMAVRVDTTYNTTVYLATGSGFENLAFQGCTYQYNGAFNFQAEAGRTYYLQVDGVGTVFLDLVQVVPPPNDNIANAEVITGMPFSTSVDVTFAGLEQGEPLTCPYSQKTVWYSFTPSETMGVRITNDYNASVYRASGSGFENLIFQGCNNNNGSVSFLAEANETYYLQFDGSIGNLAITMEQVFVPLNDYFSGAEEITSLPFSESVDITNVSFESGEPQYCSFAPKTVWYSFTPSSNALISADMTGGSATSNVLNVYQSTGSGFGGLSFLTCATYNGTALFSAQAGVTYYIQAGSLYIFDAELRVNLQEIPRPANDDFVNAEVVPALPFDHTVDLSAASQEVGEPQSACSYYGTPGKTVWYAYTPAVNGSISASVSTSGFTPVFAAYTGNSLTGLNSVGCNTYVGNLLTIPVNAGTTYYFQIGNLYPWELGGSMQFHLDVTPQPSPDFFFYPGDPSKVDVIQFINNSYDPGQIGIQSFAWDFGDGSTSTEPYPTHQYAADGDYTINFSVTTYDGRTASMSRMIQVRTHDVAIVKITTPKSATVGDTKTITVFVRNYAYPETVRVDLYKSTPSGYQWVATITGDVPVTSNKNASTQFSFNYTFSTADEASGKVTFRAVVTLEGARDAYPADNEGNAPLITIKLKKI